MTPKRNVVSTHVARTIVRISPQGRSGVRFDFDSGQPMFLYISSAGMHNIGVGRDNWVYLDNEGKADELVQMLNQLNARV